MMRTVLLALSRNRWLGRSLPRLPFARAAVRRFMPGETLDDALRASAALAPQLGTVLTRLGENLATIDDANDVAEHYSDVYQRIAQGSYDTRVSVKPTQLGLDIDPKVTSAHLHTLAESAAERGNELWIDMEDHSYVDRTFALFRELHGTHANTGICIQAYLHRTPADMDVLLPQSVAVRLVKGAYSEPADVAIQRKPEIDARYAELAVRLIEAARTHGRGPRPVLGTHDTALLERITTQVERSGGSRTDFEVHMLYGIRTAEQQRLAAEGYRVRTLISYGGAWYPWFMRRLAEKPSNVFFVVRNIFGG
jgi:proline dehydrogenase